MAEIIRKVNIMQPIDSDRVPIETDPFHPTALVVTLPLDSEPSYVWLTLFEEVLSSSLDFWDRKVVISGQQLKLASDPTGMREKLHWLEGIVLATNKRVDEHNKTQSAIKDSEKIKMLDEDAVRKDIEKWTAGRIIP